MTDVYADEAPAGFYPGSQLEPPTVFERAGHLQGYLAGRAGHDLLALVRSEADEDPAALLLALALYLPRYLSKPPSLGLVLVVLAVRRAVR